METQLTIRLPADLTNKVWERAKSMRLKRSDIVRLALAQYLELPDENDRPYERVKHLAGSMHSGISDLGTNHRKYLIQKIRQRAKRTS